MSERTPQPNSQETASQQPTTLGELENGKEIRSTDEYYHEIADDFINKYAGEVAEEDREQLSASVALEVEKVFRSEQYGTKEQQVKALEKLIADLKAGSKANEQEQANPAPTEQQDNPPADETPTEPIAEQTPVDPENPEQLSESEKRKYKWHEYARMAVGLPTLATMSIVTWKNKFLKSPDETEGNYKRRLNVATVATVAVGTAFAAWQAYKVTKGIDTVSGGAGVPDFDPSDTDKSGVVDANEARDLDGNGILDANELQLDYNESIKTEQDFLASNGRIGNDFNDISGEELKNTLTVEGLPPGFDALMDQYNASPRELAAQLDQFRDAGVQFPENLDALNRQPGEEYITYIDRITEEMHRNPELHNDAVQFAGEQLMDKKALPLDSPYRSAYIEPDGKGGMVVKWDEYVRSPDPNDQIIMIDDKRGIRLPCGQPIEIVPEPVYQAPQGTGGYAAPVSYGGEGGTTPTGSNPPGGEGGVPPENPHTPETPTTPEEPETPVEPEEPETPVEPPVDKDTGLTPDLDGLTPRGLEGVLTEHPGDYDPAVDAPVTEETGPTIEEDTGPEVTVPGADTDQTNENLDNPVETGVNPETTDGETPRNDNTFNPDNI